MVDATVHRWDKLTTPYQCASGYTMASSVSGPARPAAGRRAGRGPDAGGLDHSTTRVDGLQGSGGTSPARVQVFVPDTCTVTRNRAAGGVLACADSSCRHVIGQLVEKHRALLPGGRQGSRQTAAAGPTAGVFYGGARVSLRAAESRHYAIGRHQSRPTRRLHANSTVQRRVSRLQTTS